MSEKSIEELELELEIAKRKREQKEREEELEQEALEEEEELTPDEIENRRLMRNLKRTIMGIVYIAIAVIVFNGCSNMLNSGSKPVNYSDPNFYEGYNKWKERKIINGDF